MALGRVNVAGGAVVAATEQPGPAPALLTRTAMAEDIGRLQRSDPGSALSADCQSHREPLPERTDGCAASLRPGVHGCHARPRRGSRDPDEPS